MDEPEWIADEVVRQIHELQLAEHGGMAGNRDAGLLSSALHRPRNLFAYVAETDLGALAAAYAAGIARNHPFLDGNKRTAAVVAEAFLEINGYVLDASDDEWYATMLSLAAGELAEEQLADWLRERIQPTS